MSGRVHAEPCPNCGLRGRRWTRRVCVACYRRWHRSGFAGGFPPSPRQGAPVDELAIEQAVDGYRLALNAAERREAARRLDKRGVHRDVIAVRLGCCVRTVERAIYPRQELAA